MDKLKVSFEGTTTWDKDDFRLYIKKLQQNNDVELFMLTTETDTVRIDAIKTYLDMDSNHVIQYATDTTKRLGIIANQINIHFDPDVEFSADLSDTTNPKIWGIYVSKYYDRYKVKMKYSVQFEFIVKNIFSEKTNC